MHTQTLEAPPAQKKKSTTRLPFLDWTRGMAATIMLQGHVFHSFARPETRESGPYVISQFIGGIAPAIFLFLTGVTLAFMMHGMERKAASRKDRVITAFRRAGYLGLLAFAFRSNFPLRIPVQRRHGPAESRHPELHGARYHNSCRAGPPQDTVNVCMPELLPDLSSQ